MPHYPTAKEIRATPLSPRCNKTIGMYDFNVSILDNGMIASTVLQEIANV